MSTAQQLILPIQDMVQVVSAPVTLPEGTRGILVGVAGNMNVTLTTGNPHTGVPFVAGLTPGFFISIESLGTAGNVWALL